MWSAEVVLVCALGALGRAPSTLPPIELVNTRPPGVSAHAEGFVRSGEHRIYLLTGTEVFRSAQASDTRCGNYRAVRKIASVIIHEEFHLQRPGDEKGAYAAQLTALAAMGIGYTHPVYVGVRRSMMAALERPRPDRVLLARRAP
jgi:hypothetical protein